MIVAPCGTPAKSLVEGLFAEMPYNPRGSLNADPPLLPGQEIDNLPRIRAERIAQYLL